MILTWFLKGEGKGDQRSVSWFSHLLFGKPLGHLTLGCLKLVLMGQNIHFTWPGPTGPDHPPGLTPHPNLKHNYLFFPNSSPFFFLRIYYFVQHMALFQFIFQFNTLFRSDIPVNNPVPPIEFLLLVISISGTYLLLTK